MRYATGAGCRSWRHTGLPPVGSVPAGRRPPGRFRWTGSVMLRVLRGLGSLAGLLLIMVGIPAGLVWFPGWPLPRHWPHDQAT